MRNRALPVLVCFGTALLILLCAPRAESGPGALLALKAAFGADILAAAGSVTGGGIVPGGAGQGGVPRSGLPGDEEYYYLMSDCDGSTDIQVLSAAQGLGLKKSLADSYREAGEKWNELKKKWHAAVGAKTFPVSPPRTPKIEVMGKVPTDDRSRDRMTERNQNRVELYAACIITDQKGQRTAESIRQDKVFGRQRKMDTEYAEAIIAIGEARKTNPDAPRPAETPKRPQVLVYRGEMPSDAAAKMVEKIAQKLTEKADKQPEEAAPQKPQ